MPAASVCNDGFPGAFNLSFTEAEMIERYGQYLDYDQDLIYSKVQPVIRHNDWPIIENDAENRYRYLGVFDMADIAGAIILQDGSRMEEICRFTIQKVYDLLIHKLGFNADNLRVSYFSGGEVEQATNGKYSFLHSIPPDHTVNIWRELGLADKQLIPDQSRDTFLALNVFGLHTPWGYRQEINYLHQGKLLDIATVEHLRFRPVYESKEIVGLTDFNHSLIIAGAGIERLLMVINNYSSVYECKHIQPIVERILEISQSSKQESAIIVAEALRTIHRIVSDCGSFSDIKSRHRKYKFKMYRSAFRKHSTILGLKLSDNVLRDLFLLNAKLQNYYPELESSVEIAVRELRGVK